MQCPDCGAQIPPVAGSSRKASNAEGSILNSMIKKATSGGNKLKSLGRKRPDLEKGGMTRGGRYSRD